MQFIGRLREQDSDASSSTYQLKGLSDRRSSSTATYSPSHMVNLREELDGAITLSSVGDIIEYSKHPYVIPKLTNARYKLPPSLTVDFRRPASVKMRRPRQMLSPLSSLAILYRTALSHMRLSTQLIKICPAQPHWHAKRPSQSVQAWEIGK